MDGAPAVHVPLLLHVALDDAAGLPDGLDRRAMQAQEVALEARGDLHDPLLDGRAGLRRHNLWNNGPFRTHIRALARRRGSGRLGQRADERRHGAQHVRVLRLGLAGGRGLGRQRLQLLQLRRLLRAQRDGLVLAGLGSRCGRSSGTVAQHRVQAASWCSNEALGEVCGRLHVLLQPGEEQPRLPVHHALLWVLLDLDVATGDVRHLLHCLALVAHQLADDCGVYVQVGREVADLGLVTSAESLQEVHAVGDALHLPCDLYQHSGLELGLLLVMDVEPCNTSHLLDLLDRQAFVAQELAQLGGRELEGRGDHAIPSWLKPGLRAQQGLQPGVDRPRRAAPLSASRGGGGS
mmetsp:Transcript_36390/g.104831  ORF Transcript_36390/g.104831 Transcript_36390/m.104831 type:complete len:350 (+) Transcript_36390:359-1408(+)